MTYEYEKENIRKLNNYNVISGISNITKPIEELHEVYRKAKAFDKVLNVSKFQHEEECFDEVLEIINKYEEEL